MTLKVNSKFIWKTKLIDDNILNSILDIACCDLLYLDENYCVFALINNKLIKLNQMESIANSFTDQNDPKFYDKFYYTNRGTFTVVGPHGFLVPLDYSSQKVANLKSFNAITNCVISSPNPNFICFTTVASPNYSSLRLDDLCFSGSNLKDGSFYYTNYASAPQDLVKRTPDIDITQTVDGKYCAVFQAKNYDSCSQLFEGEILLLDLQKDKLAQTPVTVTPLTGFWHSYKNLNIPYSGIYPTKFQFSPTSTELLHGYGHSIHLISYSKNYLCIDKRWTFNIRFSEYAPTNFLTAYLRSANFNHDGTYICACFGTRYVHVINTKTGKEDLLLDHGPDEHVLNAKFSPNGDRIVSSTVSGQVYLW